MVETKGKIDVLIVGSGGREHAIAWKISKSPLAGRVFLAPGNGGTAQSFTNVPLATSDIESLCEFAETNNCFTIVGPETPLALGIVDRFRAKGLEIFGPTKEQALLETSKVYSKNFMKQIGIETANYEAFSDFERAIEFSHSKNGRVVIKADGLASGKGVFVCSSTKEAERAIHSMMVERSFGSSGETVIIEDMLEGREVSLIALCDGRDATFLGTAVDHKRAYDGGKGPNTGGMGAYSPASNSPAGEKLVEQAMEKIIRPAVRVSRFQGFLYAGLMICKDGLKVLEFNARLGDPEAQVILPLLSTDLLEALLKVTRGNGAVPLPKIDSKKDLFSCGVVMCSQGYPERPNLGDEISGLPLPESDGTILFHSGTKKSEENVFFTSGGRVLCATGLGTTLELARREAYRLVNKIYWRGEFHRKDIGSFDEIPLVARSPESSTYPER